MITKFTNYSTTGPQLNDYIYALYNHSYTKDLDDFLKDKIGTLTEITYDTVLKINYFNVKYQYFSTVKNKDIPSSFTFKLKDIKYYSKNIKDVELYIEALKYNL